MLDEAERHTAERDRPEQYAAERHAAERDGAAAEVALGAGVRVAVLRQGMPAAFGAEAAGGEPGTWPLTLVSGGPLVVRRDRVETRLEPGELALWDPARSVTVSAGGGAARATVLRLPPRALPIPERELSRLAARPAPSTSGPAALLARFLEGVAEQATALRTARTDRLGPAAIALAAAFLTSPPTPREPPAQPSPHDELLARLTAFITAHLDDPELSPKKIAAAHHISLRHLHHLFQREARTVGRYIREQRLQHCLADLADPALANLSVGRIGARWGFGDDAVFCRTFKHAYGTTPGAWRTKHLRPR
jgi:AraC-like DNA-binding protein